MGPAL